MHELNPSYISPRPDVEALVPQGVRRVLDVGCSIGSLGESIRKARQCEVFGVELSDEIASIARTRLDFVISGDAAAALASPRLQSERFDAIVFADILEHLQDPWATLRMATQLLAPAGVVIASIPNVRHIDTLWNLAVKGRWPYRDRGIHDRTHLRFFTKRNVLELLDQANLKIDRMDVNYRLFERPHDWNAMASVFAVGPLKEFLAFQYLVRARP
jgi:methionine biosynthesis protein MetW